jgi:hypothetical protein
VRVHSSTQLGVTVLDLVSYVSCKIPGFNGIVTRAQAVNSTLTIYRGDSALPPSSGLFFESPSDSYSLPPVSQRGLSHSTLISSSPKPTQRFPL